MFPNVRVTPVALNELNEGSAAEFTRVVGGVFESSAWIAQAACRRRPFASVEHLHFSMCEVVRHASADQQLALIRAHPDLVGGAAQNGSLSSASKSEQVNAGLDRLTADEIEIFRQRNAEYRDRFGFPFVICARLNRKEAIMKGFDSRLKNSRAEEIRTALEEIYKIADLRLRDIVQSSAARLI